MREAYVICFFALLNRDGSQLALGLKDIVRHEWALWAQGGKKRAAGIVNFGAAALCTLALERGMPVALPADTIPELVLTQG